MAAVAPWGEAGMVAAGREEACVGRTSLATSMVWQEWGLWRQRRALLRVGRNGGGNDVGRSGEGGGDGVGGEEGKVAAGREHVREKGKSGGRWHQVDSREGNVCKSIGVSPL